MGINQVHVRNEIGLSFAAALQARSCGRTRTSSWSARSVISRPAAIAIKAALTGHLVLSTAAHQRRAEHDHPYDRHGDRGVQRGERRQPGGGPAAGAPRSARSARRRSNYARRWKLPPWAQILKVSRALPSMRGTGCDAAGGTGYRGRAGLYEVMAMSPELRRMILTRRVRRGPAGAGGLRRDAHASGWMA